MKEKAGKVTGNDRLRMSGVIERVAADAKQTALSAGRLFRNAGERTGSVARVVGGRAVETVKDVGEKTRDGVREIGHKP